MIVTLKNDGDPDRLRRALAAHGLWVRRLEGGPHVQYVVDPHSRRIDPDVLRALPDVEGVATEPSKTPRVDAQPRVVEVAGVRIGAGEAPAVMAGPCAVESRVQIRSAARRLAADGAQFLRGGAYKPRTSPYSFQGHGEEALRWLREAAHDHGLGVVTEAMGAEEVPLVAEYTDLVQIGSRNMHNYALLRTVGSTGKPVLLKRGMAATVDEWLGAGEYLLLHGASAVLFCERGIRGFDPSTRNVLDLGAVALLTHAHGLPVIVDPSHGTGRRDLVPALSRAAIAAGAAGLMLETHETPGDALSDGPQALVPDELSALLRAIQEMSR